MNKFNKSIVLISSFFLLLFVTVNVVAQKADKLKTMGVMVLANRYLMDKCPDIGKAVVPDTLQSSKIFARGVYFEGLMALYKITGDPSYLNFAIRWGQVNNWDLPGGSKTRSADNQSFGQTYIDLYRMDRFKEERIKSIKSCIDSMIETEKIDYWTTIDALQMAMPVFARLGSVYNEKSYFGRMDQMYQFTKLKQGKTGLYSQADHLWWRDKDFVSPYKEPNGKDCFWSRGNGYVVAALVRTIEFLPPKSKYRKEYLKTLNEMFEALVPLQRNDGFWNVSLNDSTHFGGKETTGTSLFVYGMAWGINEGLISRKTYLPVVKKAWSAIVKESVRNNGSLGYVQGAGKEPADSQPVGYEIVPDFEDFGLGCFLLAGSEMYKLEKSLEPKVKEPKPEKATRKSKDKKE